MNRKRKNMIQVTKFQVQSNLNVIIEHKIELNTLNIGYVLRRSRGIQSNIPVKY